MKCRKSWVVISTYVAWAVGIAACGNHSSSNGSDDATPGGTPDAGNMTPAGVPFGRLRVQDGKLVDATGNQIMLKGLGLGALDAVKAEGHWDRDYFANARSWNAAVVRLPVDPVAYRSDPAQSLSDIDSAVAWCKRSNLYLIIDYHVIGNVEQGLFEYGDSTASTWQDINDFGRRWPLVTLLNRR